MKQTATTLLLVLLTFPALAQTEKLAGLETVHGMLANGKGSRVQTILTRPAGSSGKLPAVMLVQWLSCDGIEVRSERLGGMNELMKRIAMHSGAVMLRVEKPGVGASEGPACGDLDFETELAGYRAGLAMLRQHAWVDPERIVLIGMSNGGGILPLVSGDKPVAGYIVVNSWVKTWYEHMLEFMRTDAELQGLEPGEVTHRMRGFEELYADYLIGKKIPGDIVKQKPHLAPLWDDEPARQYGRPSVFYHQLQDLNLAEAWSKIDRPTLVVWGEYDWIMGRDDHERIVRLVNRNKPGAARLFVVPRATHGLNLYEDMTKARSNTGRQPFHDPLFDEVNRWLNGTL